MLAEFSSLRGQRQAVVGACEQGNAELAFQFGDLAADGWMAGAELAPGGGEAAGLSHRDEGLAEVPVHRNPVHSWNRPCSILNRSMLPVQPYNAPHRDAG